MSAVPASRFALGRWPTPLHRLTRIEASLGGGPLYAKRDDLAGFGVAGNKTRPLEYLVGAALAEGAEVLVTGGRADSNFCPAAAAAAAAAGLACELVMASDAGPPIEARSPNMNLSLASGAVLNHVRAAGAAIDLAIAARADAIRATGRRAYAMPRGGSMPIGCLGFADGAHELDRQLADAQLVPAAVVCAVGSGASYAGLLAGAGELQWAWPVLGASVSRPLAEISATLCTLVEQASALLAGTRPAPAHLIDALGAGHGVAGDDEVELAGLALRTEGLLLDPTYTAKSFALAVRTAREQAGPVVFWHTGGIPAALAASATGAALAELAATDG